MEVDWSNLHVLANTSELASEGLLSLLPASQTQPSELPRIFWDKMLEMRGRDAILVLEKRLRATDLDPNQGRLSTPKGQQTRQKFLSSNEVRTLDSKKAITVSLIEPCLEVRHGLQLKRWNYRGKAFSYVLTTVWNDVHQHGRNRLAESSLVQLWSFRADARLCFCLVNKDLVN